LQELLVF